jgi:resuscitation-promoting factor RpfB
MRRAYSFVLPILFFLISCQPKSPSTITIIDGDQIHQLITTERIPASLLTQADVQLATNDIVLLNGNPIALNQSLPTAQTYTLQVQRAVALTVNGKIIQATAQTIGEALSQAGAQLYASDQISPPIQTSITGAMNVKYVPSSALTVTADGKPLQIRSSSATVGGALAEAGIPLLGLDSSQPSENEALPSNGQIQVTRVSESILLSEKSIPFQTDYQQSADVELDQQKILQPGQTGLSVSRVRIVYEDGQEASRQNESETVVRAPQDQIVGYGTKVVIHTTTINGVQIQYWRAMSMYATSYSPCRSGGSKCYSGTSSGQPVQKGEVAVKYSWYLAMEGQKLFIPGYGFATIEDVCGGCVGKPWVDLGYSDSDYQDWSQTVTVYFLGPAPATIPSLN